MTYVNPNVRRPLPRLEFSNKPKLIMTANLVKQIKKLHNRVGSKEWSGELITRETGSIADLPNWTITAEEIFLVDVGSSGYTSYEVDKGSFKAPDIVELYNQFPGLLTGELKNQHIHTHHNMDSFFSGTDWENLEDRASVSNYFIMLIVNMRGKYIAKVAFKAIVETPAIDVTKDISFFNDADEYPGYRLPSNQPAQKVETLVVMDLDVTYEQVEEEPEDWFDERFSMVKKNAEEEARKVTTYPQTNYNQYPQRTNIPVGSRTEKDNKRKETFKQSRMYDIDDAYDAMDASDNYGYQTPAKRIMEMNEQEWKETQETEYDNIKLYDAHHLINTVLEDDLKTFNYNSPLPALKKFDNLSYVKLEDKAEEILIGIDINTEALYPNCSDEWALSTLKFLDDNILETAKGNRMSYQLSRKIKMEITKRERNINEDKKTAKSTTYHQNSQSWVD
jgi:hypothetical protein